MRKVSKKQAARLREYRKTIREYVREKYGAIPEDGIKIPCEIKSPVCTGWVDDNHHSKGRLGDNLTDKDSFRLGCRACHNYIEHDAAGIKWARIQGHVKNRA